LIKQNFLLELVIEVDVDDATELVVVEFPSIARTGMNVIQILHNLL
jgi:hypothetical protein